MVNEVPKETLSDETFKKAVLEFRERIFLVILRFVRNRDDARDLTQETFIRAYRSKANFRGDSSLYTWLYRIAVNVALNYKSRSHSSDFSSLEETTEIVDDHSPSDGILSRELAKNVETAIAKLPRRQKMVFILRYYEEKAHAEIAEILGITEGAVKANYHQAIMKLRARLTPYIREEI
jgi:RNA polymerase sigma-70 factor (ECF subfamily)